MTGQGRGRWGAVDVHYPPGGGACAALVVAADRRFAHVIEERVRWLARVAAYRPGGFFDRELPPLLAVLAIVDPLELVLIDGYVDLDPAGRPGLGAHLHARLAIPVVGVAKSAFRTATHAIPVRRGTATRPLYVTAAGLAVDEAAGLVARMAGSHRLPDALRRVDALARGGAGRTANSSASGRDPPRPDASCVPCRSPARYRFRSAKFGVSETRPSGSPRTPRRDC